MMYTHIHQDFTYLNDLRFHFHSTSLKVDAFFPIGVYTGMELSTHVRGSFGVCGNFVASMALAAAAMLYNLAFVKDSR